ncbi:universal stress protein [Micromonospora profundi]|uniref:Universal stress protein n=1 Tax=Micromonospora profundi TaxID=1420889 RepID=A0AAJ6HRI2_9ACTN|nr:MULTISPECIES: universal stress protein [Micromonospora]KOX09050.1 universal stress protein UspA [Micromonospora sp. NRRL B-16802]NJC13245.1 nucleotide-binding universal stress UspA family protein [Micromonospora profundi]WLS44862.1 universal stress protein [Micromonospora profundi]
MNRPVVAGVDGSPSSLVAAEHAARAALLRSRPLLLVHGYLHPLGYGVPLNPYDLGVPAPSAEAQKMLERTAADLADRWPGLTVEVRQVAGGPGATMIEESRQADLVVVGSRGLGGFVGLLLGSVGAQVAAHAHCPVLVVRPDEQPIDMDAPVLVGVDGSEASRLAAGYGAAEATLRKVPLVLVHVGPPGEDRATPEEVEESQAAYQAEAVRLLADASAAVRAEYPDLVVREHPVRAAGAAQGLIEASGTASLLVVGTRGRHGFTGLLLGSVSQAVIQHAHCPVLVAHRYPA